MNAAACQQVMDGVGTSVADSLRAVDCAAGMSAEAAFGRLFGANGALQFVVFEGPVAKRYRITPGAEPGIDAALAAAK